MDSIIDFMKVIGVFLVTGFVVVSMLVTMRLIHNQYLECRAVQLEANDH